MHWIDFDAFDRLTEELLEIDGKIIALRAACAADPDPDGSGLLDDFERLVGDGFLRCQLYLVERRGPLHGADAYRCGPMHRTRYVAEIINAAANYRKHRAEWPHDPADAQRPQLRTEAVLRDAGVLTREYVVTRVLHEIRPDGAFAGLLPLIVEWRDALDAAARVSQPA
jgi:hypothetical protein